MVWNHFTSVLLRKITTYLMIENVGLKASRCILKSKKVRIIAHFVHTLTKYRSLGNTMAIIAAHGNDIGAQHVDWIYVRVVAISGKVKSNW